jgi:prevent-host-death family protein
LDILGALTQIGIQQTAAGGKARAFCDIAGDQLGTMETNEFLNLIHYASADNLESIGEIFGVCRLERGKEPFPPWRHRDRSPGLRRFGARPCPRGNFARHTLIATLCSYNVNMEVGIRDAKTKLSKLVEAVLDGQEVFLTNRGARVVQLVRTPKAPTQGRGRGAWKGKIHLYDGWDSRDEDKRIEEMFQTLHEAGPK